MPVPPPRTDAPAPPPGTRVRLDQGARRFGALLVGGAPARAVRLGPGGLALLADGGFELDGSPARAALAEQLVGAGLAAYDTEASDRTVPTEGPEPVDDVLVVVPAYERAAGVERLLDALGAAAPVLVVDDASPDPSALRAAAARHDAEVLRLPTNLGPAGARNAGLAEARRRGAAFVLFVDSDVVVGPDALARLRRCFLDPRLALAAPRIGPLEEAGSALARYEAVASSLDRGPRSATVAPGAPVAYVPSAVLLARVEALGDGFDETLPVGEDVDLVWRLHAAGWRVRYDAGASARHDHRVRLRDWAGRRADYGRSAGALADRHGDLVAPAVLAPLGVLEVGALLWQRPAGAVLAGAGAVEIARRLAARLGGDADARRAAVTLVALAGWMNVEQLAAALLRHHWPLTVLGLATSRRVRRLVAVAAAVDTLAAWARQQPDLDPATYALLRRLDDLSYGYGVWRGAVATRSGAALLPAWRKA
ncbi:mycofactocin biosynthesis glycosyltransferase MftF [Nocardioides zeae]|uniref:Mycofactocin biosynthesis glycosyltransferase MftF n=1 Tax=Nocardioides imazamoxiresistens TaxID=3231893 RepID=A0ABU3Q1C4_9ACTN|nr:mycofactocin biosynthesis glycosyltransferase MftF [Nocardioides zeae]MDT9595285.1 mycofactocin biosynthesis glycosyltransferase MftF [Nocardioides zeae]